MAIDPKILARMQRSSPESDEPELPNVVSDTGDLPLLRGSPAQVKWAITIRRNILALSWPAATLYLLKSVADSTWWIANKGAVATMKFKAPAPHQCVGGVVAQTEMDMDESGSPVEQEQYRSDSTRISDAEQWAKSVSQNPALAESAILAVLSKLYKTPRIKEALRAASRRARDSAENAVAKDVDAINRMLQ